MTTQEAYQILSQVAENFRGTLQEHKAIQTALMVFKPKNEDKKETKAEA